MNLLQNAFSWGGQGGAEVYAALSWWVSHPFLAIAVALFVLVLLQATLELLSNLIKQIVLWIVRLPYKLVYGLISKTVRPFNTLKLPLVTPNSAQTRERLITILNRLQRLRQEQDHLLQELQDILILRPQESTPTTPQFSSDSEPPSAPPS